jgi:ribosome-interacting GTPase 1
MTDSTLVYIAAYSLCKSDSMHQSVKIASSVSGLANMTGVQMRGDHDVDDLVDVIEGNRLYVPCLYILNKIDQITLEELEVIDRMENYVPICAYHEWNLDGVLEAVWDRLELIR